MGLSKTTLMALLGSSLLTCACEKRNTAKSDENKNDAIQKEQATPASCGLQLTTIGGSFSPDKCELQRVTGGGAIFCNDPQNPNNCGPVNGTDNNTIILTTTSVATDKIASITLFKLPKSSGTFQIDSDTGQADFSGRMVDGKGVESSLLKGTLKLEAQGTAKVQVSFDLYFADNIQVKGSGLINVKDYEAP